MDIKFWTEKLRAADIYVVDDKPIAYGHQLIIYEGATINFYTNGTILVQGKTMPYRSDPAQLDRNSVFLSDFSAG